LDHCCRFSSEDNTIPSLPQLPAAQQHNTIPSLPQLHGFPASTKKFGDFLGFWILV